LNAKQRQNHKKAQHLAPGGVRHWRLELCLNVFSDRLLVISITDDTVHKSNSDVQLMSVFHSQLFVTYDSHFIPGAF